MATFEDQVKRWVTLDNQVRILTDQTKTLRKEKESTEEALFTYAENHQLKDATINISDGRLKFVTTKVTAGLTLAHVEASIRKCLTQETLVKQIMTTIKADREVKEVADIKRYKSANKR